MHKIPSVLRDLPRPSCLILKTQGAQNLQWHLRRLRCSTQFCKQLSHEATRTSEITRKKCENTKKKNLNLTLRKSYSIWFFSKFHQIPPFSIFSVQWAPARDFRSRKSNDSNASLRLGDALITAMPPWLQNVPRAAPGSPFACPSWTAVSQGQPANPGQLAEHWLRICLWVHDLSGRCFKCRIHAFLLSLKASGFQASAN